MRYFALAFVATALGATAACTSILGDYRVDPSLQSAAAPIEGLTQIAAGDKHTCALKGDGSVVCWGDNAQGQLGADPKTLPASSQPIALLGLPKITQISAGFRHTCAVDAAKNVYCWGSNDSGQIGNGTKVTDPNGKPSRVGAGGDAGAGGAGDLSDIVQLASGDVYTCATTSTGASQCWGGNGFGQFGSGNQIGSTKPVAVKTTDTKPASQLSAGTTFSCGLLKEGDKALAHCWGQQTSGQLGNGATSGVEFTPVKVVQVGNAPLDGARAIEVGASHACVVDNAENALCWGNNTFGQIGSKTSVGQGGISLGAVSVPGLDTGNVVALAAGESFTCALLKDGTVGCLGKNDSQQLGQGALNTEPVPNLVKVPDLAEVASISAGRSHTCAVTKSGAAKCWGLNGNGQLGNGKSGIGASPPASVIAAK